MFILPAFGFDITLKDNLIIGALYTVISVARSYVIRRWFNQMLHRAAQRLAGGSA
jgi:CO/xanthine dehydrogenase FAD-binding subunit